MHDAVAEQRLENLASLRVSDDKTGGGLRLVAASVGAGPVPARLPDRANNHVDIAGECAPCGAAGWHGACPYSGSPPFQF